MLALDGPGNSRISDDHASNGGELDDQKYIIYVLIQPS